MPLWKKVRMDEQRLDGSATAACRSGEKEAVMLGSQHVGKLPHFPCEG